MSGINVEHIMTAALGILCIQSLCFIIYLISKKKLSKSRFFRFLGILFIGIACSLIPMGPLSVIFGFPAVLLNSILIACFLDKDNI